MPTLPEDQIANPVSEGTDIPINQYKHRYKIIGNTKLTNYTEKELLQDLSRRIDDGRHIIIPIGLPQAGKSMFIASLMAYAFRTNHSECNFSDMYAQQDISAIPAILKRLDDKDTVNATNANEITFADIDMTATHRKKSIKITLIDLAGEDIARLIGSLPIKSEEQKSTKEKIEKLLASCVAGKAIFGVVTPVDTSANLGQQSQVDRDESDAMKAFIDIIKAKNAKLYALTKFLVVVSKWDILPQRIYASKYLSIHRNSLFNEISGKAKYGLIPYSVGDVVGDTVIRVNLRSPQNFWFTLFRFCTGIHVLPWWKRYFN
jgi:hypothetical protein